MKMMIFIEKLLRLNRDKPNLIKLLAVCPFISLKTKNLYNNSWNDKYIELDNHYIYFQEVDSRKNKKLFIRLFGKFFFVLDHNKDTYETKLKERYIHDNLICNKLRKKLYLLILLYIYWNDYNLKKIDSKLKIEFYTLFDIDVF